MKVTKDMKERARSAIQSVKKKEPFPRDIPLRGPVGDISYFRNDSYVVWTDEEIDIITKFIENPQTNVLSLYKRHTESGVDAKIRRIRILLKEGKEPPKQRKCHWTVS